MKSFCLAALLLFYTILFSQPSNPGLSPAVHSPESNSIAQSFCFTDILRQLPVPQGTAPLRTEAEMNELIFNQLQFNRSARSGGSLLYIPVIVHIIHNNGPENIHDSLVIKGIKHLNDAFANTGAYYTPDGEDMGIRFCLATQTPNGYTTTGITRVQSMITDLTSDNGSDTLLKNMIRLDPTQYINIWLVREITSNAMGAGVAGYAYLPSAHGSNVDGIVNEARWFGSSVDNSKVHIHEMGHYLGLYHTFEGGCGNNNCMTDGDHVCDTPPDATTAATICGNAPNSCTSDTDDNSPNNPFRTIALGGWGDQDDLMEDYMDYGSQSCQKLFTFQQGERMRAALQGIRSSLLSSHGCETSCMIVAQNIDSPADNTVVPAGAPFTATSSHAGITNVNREWRFKGAVIGTSANLNYTFSNSDVGKHYLYHYWINVQGNCSEKDSVLIDIRCMPPAAFTVSPVLLERGDTATFTATATNAVSYAWFLNGQQVSTSASFNHTFLNGGAQYMYLVTGNGQCFDTSAVQFVGVGACAGGENNHWVAGIFAGNDIDFSTGTPVATAIPMNGTNFIYSQEGIATMSDRQGNLLFYSDGNSLFNRNKEQFYANMGAQGSSSQGVLIIPDPADLLSYYVFTADGFGGMVSGSSGTGLSYVQVDMRMNGGLGGVSLPLTNLMPSTSEKLTATRHCNGTDIWVIAHGVNNDSFYVYPVTASGVQAPIISAVGVSQYLSDTIGIQTIGMHRVSPQGDKLFSSNHYLGFHELFDFDNTTGIISNPYRFPSIGGGVYSAEFSPDGTKLYLHAENTYKIYQYDLSSGIPQVIANTLTEIGTTSSTSFIGTFYLANNGKIYIARNSVHLDAINNPNALGAACDFETEAVFLPRYVAFGLNNILANPAYDGPKISGPLQVCTGANDVRYRVSCGINTWEYHGSNTFSALSVKEASISFTTPGTDTLICHRANTCSGATSDTLFIEVNSAFADLGNDTAICQPGELTLDAGVGFTNYVWSNGANATSHITITQPGVYWVAVTGYGGCVSRDTIVVSSYASVFDVPNPPRRFLCDSSIFSIDTFYAQKGNFTHVWEPGQSPVDFFRDYFFGTTGWARITYTDPAGCVDRDTFFIERISTFPPVHIGNDTTICPGAVVVLSFNSQYDYARYIWSDGSTGNSFTVYQPGTYWLRYEDSVCRNAYYDFINIAVNDVPVTTLSDSVIECSGSPQQLDAGPGFTGYFWQNGDTGRYHTVTQPGIYWVQAQSNCGTTRDTSIVQFGNGAADVIGFPDTITLCSNALPYALSPAQAGQFSSYHWNTGHQGASLLITQGGSYSLTTTNPCGTASDSTEIIVFQQPTTLLPADNIFCDGEPSMTLYGATGATNTWSTGAITDSIVVTVTDTYTLSSLGANGCITADSIYVAFNNIYLHPVADTTLCAGDTIYVTPNTNALLIHTAQGSFHATVPVSDTGSISFSVNENGCYKSIDFYVGLRSGDFRIKIPDTTRACMEKIPVMVTANSSVFTHYLWNTGATTAGILLHAEGLYSVQAWHECGISSDSTVLDILPVPFFSLGNDTVIQQGSLTIGVPDIYNQYTWNIAGNTSHEAIIQQSGTYSLTVKDANGCLYTDSIMISIGTSATSIDNDSYLHIPQVFSLSERGLIAQHRNVVVSDIVIYDATGKTVSAVNRFPVVWDGAVNGSTPAPAGMYYYAVSGTARSQPFTHRGKVLLVP